MFKYILPVLIVAVSFAAVAQQTVAPVKFKDFVFEEVQVQKDLLYKSHPGPGTSKKTYRFDFYEARADSSPYRPLIIWLHGGGFKFGRKQSGGLPRWSKTFARRGYACAAVNYRSSKKHPLKNYPDLVEGCAAAVEDVNEAIQFFKKNYTVYRVDTTRIILGGNSAGGMIALQAVYSSPAEMAMLVHQGDSTDAAPMHNPQHVAGIINFWGALFDLDWLKNARVPIVSVHGKKDRVVPYNTSNNGLYGSLAVHRVADSLGIPNKLKTYDNYAHELQKHFNPIFAGGPAKKRWLQAGQFAADFLYEEIFRTK